MLETIRKALFSKKVALLNKYEQRSVDKANSKRQLLIFMSKKKKSNAYDKSLVADIQGRLWRRYAIPDGVTLANGLSKERIEKENLKKKQNRKLQEQREKEKARRKAQVERQRKIKEWQERPQILFTPMGNKR